MEKKIKVEDTIFLKNLSPKYKRIDNWDIKSIQRVYYKENFGL